MWEYRLIWERGQPSWWGEAWHAGLDVLGRRARQPETRPDTYLVLAKRPDVGLKLRGGEDGGFEVKIRHRAQEGRELWEKIPFYRWNDLEADRFAAAIQRELPRDGGATKQTPLAAVKDLLRRAGIDAREAAVDKRRLQTRASELSSILKVAFLDPLALVELVEFSVAGQKAVHSICFESATAPGRLEMVDDGSALAIGYPQFLDERT